MEFLKGKDLVPYTKQGNLMPLAARHEHRRARGRRACPMPMKTMWCIATSSRPTSCTSPSPMQVKVTDFGIARITDSSKTKTGMVLGTPSYMSPEQLAGKKIDGRSDLFSLGVMLYQMSCGKLPFEGDSMAQLMFRIANEAHPDIRGINPDLPDCLVAIIDRAMTKDPDARYQTGAEWT
jgi:serine/threonine protein kinase